MNFEHGIARRTASPPTLRRLSEMPTGQDACIAFTRHANTGRRMLVLGLLDGVGVNVESRDRNGDLIIVADGNRYHVRARHAERIWVQV